MKQPLYTVVHWEKARWLPRGFGAAQWITSPCSSLTGQDLQPSHTAHFISLGQKPSPNQSGAWSCSFSPILGSAMKQITCNFLSCETNWGQPSYGREALLVSNSENRTISLFLTNMVKLCYIYAWNHQKVKETFKNIPIDGVILILKFYGPPDIAFMWSWTFYKTEIHLASAWPGAHSVAKVGCKTMISILSQPADDRSELPTRPRFLQPA